MNVGTATSLQHECTHTCCVQHEFGNLYKCLSSGQLHVCDANCDQRLYNDRYSTICRVSKKLFPPFESDSATMCVDQAPRKRRPDEEIEGSVADGLGGSGPRKSQTLGHGYGLRA